jgi:hypothetical protein
MQRAHQAGRAQPTFAQACVGMRADVVEREHSFARMAQHDLACPDEAGPHAPERKLRKLQYRRKLRHGGLEQDLGLENGYRLAADPDPGKIVAGEFEFDLDASRAMQ